MLGFEEYSLNAEKRKACDILEDELMDFVDMLEKLTNLSALMYNEYFYTPHEDSKRKQKKDHLRP